MFRIGDLVFRNWAFTFSRIRMAAHNPRFVPVVQAFQSQCDKDRDAVKLCKDKLDNMKHVVETLQLQDPRSKAEGNRDVCARFEELKKDLLHLREEFELEQKIQKEKLSQKADLLNEQYSDKITAAEVKLATIKAVVEDCVGRVDYETSLLRDNKAHMAAAAGALMKLKRRKRADLGPYTKKFNKKMDQLKEKARISWEKKKDSFQIVVNVEEDACRAETDGELQLALNVYGDAFVELVSLVDRYNFSVNAFKKFEPVAPVAPMPQPIRAQFVSKSNKFVSHPMSAWIKTCNPEFMKVLTSPKSPHVMTPLTLSLSAGDSLDLSRSVYLAPTGDVNSGPGVGLGVGLGVEAPTAATPKTAGSAVDLPDPSGVEATSAESALKAGGANTAKPQPPVVRKARKRKRRVHG